MLMIPEIACTPRSGDCHERIALRPRLLWRGVAGRLHAWHHERIAQARPGVERPERRRTQPVRRGYHRARLLRDPAPDRGHAGDPGDRRRDRRDLGRRHQRRRAGQGARARPRPGAAQAGLVREGQHHEAAVALEALYGRVAPERRPHAALGPRGPGRDERDQQCDAVKPDAGGPQARSVRDADRLQRLSPDDRHPRPGRDLRPRAPPRPELQLPRRPAGRSVRAPLRSRPDARDPLHLELPGRVRTGQPR